MSKKATKTVQKVKVKKPSEKERSARLKKDHEVILDKKTSPSTPPAIDERRAQLVIEKVQELCWKYGDDFLTASNCKDLLRKAQIKAEEVTPSVLHAAIRQTDERLRRNMQEIAQPEKRKADGQPIAISRLLVGDAFRMPPSKHTPETDKVYIFLGLIGEDAKVRKAGGSDSQNWSNKVLVVYVSPDEILRAATPVPAESNGKPATIPGAPKKPGVIATIIKALQSASEKNPITKEGVLAKLVVAFPERLRKAMLNTVHSQIPTGLKTEKKMIVKTDGKKGFWL